MQLAKNIGFYLGFVAASGLFLIVEHFTHIEFFLHVAAIPLEVLVAVFIVEKMLESRETKERRRQLMFIKSHMFRTDMRGLKKPAITMSQIKDASLEDLRKMRREAEAIEYRSPEATEEIIREYVKAFKERYPDRLFIHEAERNERLMTDYEISDRMHLPRS